MSLSPGTRVGVYEVIALLGAGGMGEVYRARDSRLQRDVALKILPEQFVSDPERLARFQREAQVLASLAHANIAHIYAIEDGPAEGGRSRALVLELVEGPTLADRIAQGPIPIDEALTIGPPRSMPAEGPAAAPARHGRCAVRARARADASHCDDESGSDCRPVVATVHGWLGVGRAAARRGHRLRSVEHEAGTRACDQAL